DVLHGCNHSSPRQTGARLRRMQTRSDLSPGVRRPPVRDGTLFAVETCQEPLMTPRAETSEDLSDRLLVPVRPGPESEQADGTMPTIGKASSSFSNYDAPYSVRCIIIVFRLAWIPSAYYEERSADRSRSRASSRYRYRHRSPHPLLRLRDTATPRFCARST